MAGALTASATLTERRHGGWPVPKSVPPKLPSAHRHFSRPTNLPPPSPAALGTPSTGTRHGHEDCSHSATTCSERVSL